MAYCRYPSLGGGGGGSGTVTSVAVSGGTTGLTTSGGPITTAGTITLAGKLVIANGGTNSSAALSNNRVMQSSGGAIVEAAAITAARALISDANGIPTQSVTTATELTYVNGVTSAIQTQLNGKQASGSYITALTGDVTASGPGSVAATIAVGAVTDTKGSLANKPSATVAATTNQALTGTPTIDGQATAAGSIILLTAQSSGAENGPWVAAAGAWSRPTWYPTGGTTQAFQFITMLVRLGTTYQGTTWRLTTSGAITIDTTATAWAVTPLAVNATTTTGLANTRIATVGITIDGGGSAITAGIKGDIMVPYACTINSVTMLADQTGSIVVDIWKDTYANYPPTIADTITAAALPTITTANKSQDTTLTGWTTTVAAGDTIRFNVNATPSAITRLNLTLKVTKTFA